MKKSLNIIVLLLIVLSLTGCGSKTLTCTRKSEEAIYTLEEKIVSKYSFSDLKKFEIHQEMELKNNSFVNAELLKQTVDIQFINLKENGANVNVKSKGNKIIVDVNADISKISKSKLKKIKLYNINESLEDAKKSFKKSGYTCK